uniref:Late secretory pathway protein AVL9 homolog n=1 Tax=Hirondellea gigas TaxID=1518452 RepID=A0A2P2I3L7_9CRUS
MEEDENERIALNVLVIGFHHKRGMQVEYCYPPLCDNDSSSSDLPEQWRHLPSLCLPDGAHNYEADTIFFHLPHLRDKDRTVFGVSCYRQIDAEKVANKTADITRNSVQKSVCVLCSLPIYGYIQERLQVTTRVYFKEADFADVRDLEGLYHDLNTANWRDKLHHGIHVSECVRVFGRNLLVLFKLLLLERGVLVYHSPVSPVARTIASLMALLPHTLPHGIMGAAATNNVANLDAAVDKTDNNTVTRTDTDSCLSINSSTDSAIEKSTELKNLSDADIKNSSHVKNPKRISDAEKKRDKKCLAGPNRQQNSTLNNGSAGLLDITSSSTTISLSSTSPTVNGTNTSKSIDSNQSEDSAVVTSNEQIMKDSSTLNNFSSTNDGRKSSSLPIESPKEHPADHRLVGESLSAQQTLDMVPSIDESDINCTGALGKIVPSEGSPIQNPSRKGCVSSLKDEECPQLNQQKQLSVDAASDGSSCAIASTQATTGADTPTNALQDSISDLRSSNSSLTSVTSRASFMSPLNNEDPGLSSPPLSSRLSSLRGRLTGAFSYWTGKEKQQQQQQETPATPACSPTEDEGDELPLSPGSGAPLVFPELQQQQSVELDPEPLAAGVPPLVPSPPELFASLQAEDCGLPLNLFTNGYLVHPYLSLQQLDVISSKHTRAFVAGTSNTLFLHKRPLYDVLVQVSEGKVEIMDPELRRQLSLSTEDLRFADNIVRQVEAVNTGNNSTLGGGVGSVSPTNASMGGHAFGSTPNTATGATHYHPQQQQQQLDVWVEGVGWAGGEEWLRHQFRVYLITMMRTSLLPEGSRELEMFNGCYMTAWRKTLHYQHWLNAGPYNKLMEVSPCHPNAGHLSIADVRIRLAHSLLGGERSRRINQTIASTGTAVVKTKEAVGGALTSARGAISSFWSSMTTANTQQQVPVAEEAVEATEEGTGTPAPSSNAGPASTTKYLVDKETKEERNSKTKPKNQESTESVITPKDAKKHFSNNSSSDACETGVTM